MRRFSQNTGWAGVTLTELIVVLAIVSLLATLAVPVVITRQREAKYAIARSECETLAKGEELCGLSHGYYVPLQVLDDNPKVAGSTPTITDSIDGELTTIQLIDVNVNPTQQLGAQDTLASTKLAVLRLESDWGGPFVQPQRVFVDPNIPPPSQTLQRTDYPLDPWLFPYRLYSPLGVVGSSAGTNPLGSPITVSDMQAAGFSNGNLTNLDRRFDRYAVVSYGPNGVTDGLNPTSPDDVVYFFGTLVRRTDTFN
ncbi:prepilin-type N-terminal cleavage/methylation domain-containing protein [Candidatus Sumerlaeota bacterium]|nr:prepilin-type N-terminal cleavage/methylation domain-containing protein [Candidatus Sumerlaeota bacterium]